MARKAAKKKTAKTRAPRARIRPGRWVMRGVLGLVAAFALILAAYAVLPVPVTPYQISESRRLGGIEKEWVPVQYISPVMLRSVVAAEDANYCEHWGFDIAALRSAIAGGARRGGSTISQQTVKNVFLWQGRSWPRKALEAVVTPGAELVWSKRRLLEIYLNVIEFGDGIFGIQAASRHYFGLDAADLSAIQAARLAAILPDPKGRSAADPSPFVRRRAAQIRDGAETIRRDGRANCFQG
ncbi:monofunctional biosynthetic peptidoglycan transglycosylase [Mangrovicoccus algicola]|uniref:Biosynthetic peptidoglycan transglycosylase n=1 Tax=Mangrovicoccus algicola TaxID=2771008 RepID=A0A8J6YUJ1_9RHOB|nr:monofunctional biosynthetic peptidoglycan transglycosylase [Mangrovicoccus algicola]MBE3638027.1 monofunctional biosynthetic peptidoglycan transglycosylase [Mangrovicoccus algicola]